MAGRVTANKMEVVTSNSNHQCVGMAVSVCTTPAAPSPIPVPYPTMAPPRSPQRKVKDAPMRTRVAGSEVLTVGGIINGCVGNEPGTLKEVVSLNTSGPCFPLVGTPGVITELGMTCISNTPCQMNKQGVGVGAGGGGGGGGGGGAGGGGGGGPGAAPPAPSANAPSPTGGGGGGPSGGPGASGSSSSSASPTSSETAADRMLSDFDDETRAAANLSPTLQRQLEQLERDGWEIQQGTPGGGSTADSRNRVITIDPNDRGATATGVIAHEVGHALYTPEPYVDGTGLSRDEYVNRNVDRHMRDEGNAQFNAAQVRDEVGQAGGPDTGIPGANTNEYQRSYDDYKSGAISRDQAVDQMGSTMGRERTSNTGENYRDYYGNTYGSHYDTHHGGGGGGTP